MVGDDQAKPNSKAGPRTAAGKVRSSRNAIRHGILSAHLLLPDEDPAEYRLLLDSLFAEMQPVGTLEQALVERIAVALWRQRRLVRVESARIQKSRQPGAMERFRLKERFGERNAALIDRLLRGEGDAGDQRWAEAVEKASRLTPLNLDSLSKQCPVVWERLASLAKGKDHIQAYLDQNFQGDLENLISKLRSDNAKISEAKAELALERDAMSLPAAPDLMARYQASLDNDLYKAMRALRESQRWRRETEVLDGTAQAA